MFYTFNQNNSGGKFVEDENLTKYVAVEGYNEKDIIKRAKKIGIYFDGCLSGEDCSCCGDRWTKPYDDDEYDDVPSIYGVPVEDDSDGYAGGLRFGLANKMKIHYKNGDITTVPWREGSGGLYA